MDAHTLGYRWNVTVGTIPLKQYGWNDTVGTPPLEEHCWINTLEHLVAESMNLHFCSRL